jgi:hypothetical protein
MRARARELALVAGAHDLYLLLKRLCGRLKLAQLSFGVRKVRIDQRSDQLGLRHRLAQQSKPFRFEPGEEDVHAGDIAVRSA